MTVRKTVGIIAGNGRFPILALKEARKEAHMTQDELAAKLGTKKSYISRLENGKCDIQLSTLYRIFEFGLGRRVSLLIG